MTNHSQIDTFLEHAKAPLDKMGAAAREFEARRDKSRTMMAAKRECLE